jgi:hypothetical protein
MRPFRLPETAPKGSNATQNGRYAPKCRPTGPPETGSGSLIAARSGTPRHEGSDNRARRQHAADRLDCQALATLGTAGIDYRAATTGLHSDQETMGTCATDFGWLVSAFHLKFLKGSVSIPMQGASGSWSSRPEHDQGNRRLSQSFRRPATTACTMSLPGPLEGLAPSCG